MIGNLGLDQLGEEDQRFLPAHIARRGGNDGGHALLRDVQLGAAEDFLQLDGHLHFAGQVRVLEFVGVANALVRRGFGVGSPKGVTFAGGKIGEDIGELPSPGSAMTSAHEPR